MGKKTDKHAKVEAKLAKSFVWHARGSSRKLGVIADMVRGKDVSQAESELEFSQKRLSSVVLKNIRSAKSNAKVLGMDGGPLFISEIYVGRSRPLKRMMPRARGRANQIEKPCCNLTVIVRERKL